MKKIILVAVMMMLLTGCGYEYRTLNNVTYVSKVEAKNHTIVTFVQENGVKRNLYWKTYEAFSLVEDEKYDIQYIFDKVDAERGGWDDESDIIEHIELSKEENN